MTYKYLYQMNQKMERTNMFDMPMNTGTRPPVLRATQSAPQAQQYLLMSQGCNITLPPPLNNTDICAPKVAKINTAESSQKHIKILGSQIHEDDELVFLVVMPCGNVGIQEHFRLTYCLHLQG
jgi:hypothetical protein